MVSLTILYTSHDTDANATVNGITWQNVMLHLISVLRNTVAPLMMLLASCDTNGSTSCIKLPRHHVASCLIVLT